MPSIVIIISLDGNILLDACLFALDLPNNLNLKLSSESSLKSVQLLETPPHKIVNIVPHVYNETLQRIYKVKALKSYARGKTKKIISDYLSLRMAEMENKLNELNGKFKANLTKNKQYHQNMRDADAMCRDLERRCVQNHERSAQLTRFHNNPSNDFDVKVLAESITAKQNTRSRHGKQIFIIASNDTSFFSAYIDRNVVAHDTVTREIRKRYDIHCHAAQAACVILPRITGEEIDKGFDPDAFLDVLAIIRLELKTPGSSEYLKSRMDGVRAEPDVQRKRAMCRELLPYVDRYVQAL